MRIFVGLTLGLAAAMVAWLLLAPGSEEPLDSSRTKTHERAPQGTGAAVPSAAQTPSATHRVAVDLAIHIFVASPDNRPLADVGVYTAASNAVDLHCPRLASTSQDGRAELPHDENIPALALWKPRFVPTFIDDPEVGRRYEVILQRAATQNFRVQTLDGEPVPGIPIILSSEGTSLSEYGLAERGPHYTRPRTSRTATSASAKTGPDGRACISALPKGRYWIEVALDATGYMIDNLAECIFVDTPSAPVTVKVRELVGSVVKFVGDEKLRLSQTRRGPDSPFVGPRPLAEMIPVQKARARLLERFPGAHVIVNGKSYAATARPELSLTVLQRSGRVSKTTVPVVPIRSIVKPWIVPLEPAGVDRSSLVTFRRSCMGIDKESLPDFDLPAIRVVARRGGARFGWRPEFGKAIRLPHGEAWVLPDRRILHGAFEAFQVNIDGTEKFVDVALGKLRHFPIQVVLADGARPKRVGLGVRGLRHGRRASLSLPAPNGEYVFWSTEEELGIRVFVAGYGRTSFKLVSGQEIERSGRKVFLLRVHRDGTESKK